MQKVDRRPQVREVESVSRPERPIASFGVSLFGGLLILIEGVLVVAASDAIGCPCWSPGYSITGATVGMDGALLALVGFVIVCLAVEVLVQPAIHRSLGITIVLFSLLSFLGGGGFFVGGVLGVIGGILAITFGASYTESGPKGTTHDPLSENT